MNNPTFSFSCCHGHMFWESSSCIYDQIFWSLFFRLAVTFFVEFMYCVHSQQRLGPRSLCRPYFWNRVGGRILSGFSNIEVCFEIIECWCFTCTIRFVHFHAENARFSLGFPLFCEKTNKEISSERDVSTVKTSNSILPLCKIWKL